MTARQITIRLGFIPLTDASIPIVAARKGFAAGRGIDLQLARETSWTNIRDRLSIGHFDAAHMLGPMPVAAALGLSPLDVPIVTPMALGTAAHAVTVSTALAREIEAAMPEARIGDPAAMGAALAAVVRRRGMGARLTFAVVHPYSVHNYALRYWLVASGIAPEAEIEIAVVPPPLMADALGSGRIDGFCVGEPWNAVAQHRGHGRIIVPGTAIWRASPEKVLGVRQGWADEHPDWLMALLHAMIDAAEWCRDRRNTGELIELLAMPDLLGVAPEDILPVFDGSITRDPSYFDFADTGLFPWKNHAEWFLERMVQWRETRPDIAAVARARASYRPDLFRRAMAERGRPVPEVDDRPERAAGSTVPGSAGPITLPPTGFFDRPEG